MPKTSVGIYVSSKYVDIVELTGSKLSPTILNFQRQEIPAESSVFSEGEKESKNSQQEREVVAIRQGLEKLNIKPQSIYTVLSSADVMIRYFDMPVLPKSEQQQAVRFEAKKYIPFKLDEIVSDFKVMPPSKEKKTMDVFFISATKERINAHVGRFQAAGMQTQGIDIISFALLRMLIIHKKTDAKDTVAILYVDNDRESVSIHIVESGMPFISRDIKMMSDDKDAVFEKIASELRVSIDYYHRQKARIEVSKILLCGEPLFTGLDSYVANDLKIITETLYDFTKVKNSEKTPSSGIVAMGAAVDGLGRSNHSVNLSPFHAVMEQRKAFSAIAVEATAAFMIIIVIYLFSMLPLKGVESQLRKLKVKSASLPKSTSLFDVKKLMDKKKSAIEEVKLLHLVQSNRPSIAKKLSIVSKSITGQRAALEGPWINKMVFNEIFIIPSSKTKADIARELSISASAFSSQMNGEMKYINSLFESLKKDKEFMESFKDIELGSVERINIRGQQVAKFSIKAFSQKIIDTKDRGRR
jgi:Tfp pilus assembly PilM family ATPase